MQTIIRNPLEQFEILDLFSISTSLIDSKFALTNLGLYIFIVTFLISIINIWIASENKKLLLHSHGTLIQESIYATNLQTVKNQIGSSNEKYLPIIFTLFIFILFNNLIGLIPYSFTPTSHLDNIINLFILFSLLQKEFTDINSFNDNISFIKSYENTDTMKIKILKNNKDKSSIYR